MTESESVALPLGDTPAINIKIIPYIKIFVKYFFKFFLKYYVRKVLRYSDNFRMSIKGVAVNYSVVSSESNSYSIL